MVQDITIQRETEQGRVLAVFDGDTGAVLSRRALPDSVCLRFVDPYGDTVFNQMQLPVLIDEVTAVAARCEHEHERELLRRLVAFLEASRDTHIYVRGRPLASIRHNAAASSPRSWEDEQRKRARGQRPDSRPFLAVQCVDVPRVLR